MDLIPAIITNTGGKDGGGGRFKGRQWHVTCRMEEVKVGGVKEGCGA
jgi:hypothetical protein